LAINRLSDNVGSVKVFATTLLHALEQERHFALVDGFAVPSKARIVIVQVGNSVRPMHLFGRNCAHDYYFKLLRKEEQGTKFSLDK
jgi:hypothetical protein